MPDTPCPRCGTPQPPDSVHTCRGRIPQPQPSDASLAACREAEEIARSNVNLAVIYYGGACTRELDAYRDAVAARVRAELLQSGTPVWVATDGMLASDPQFRTSAVFECQPQQRPNGDWQDSGGYGLLLHDVPALSPPGTCVETVVLVRGGGK